MPPIKFKIFIRDIQMTRTREWTKGERKFWECACNLLQIIDNSIIFYRTYFFNAYDNVTDLLASQGYIDL